MGSPRGGAQNGGCASPRAAAIMVLATISMTWRGTAPPSGSLPSRSARLEMAASRPRARASLPTSCRGTASRKVLSTSSSLSRLSASSFASRRRARRFAPGSLRGCENPADRARSDHLASAHDDTGRTAGGLHQSQLGCVACCAGPKPMAPWHVMSPSASSRCASSASMRRVSTPTACTRSIAWPTT